MLFYAVFVFVHESIQAMFVVYLHISVHLSVCVGALHKTGLGVYCFREYSLVSALHIEVFIVYVSAHISVFISIYTA